MTPKERMHYIGAVALLVRLHNAMPRKARGHFDADGDPLTRLAADFNAYGFGVQMIENGDSWMLDTAERPARTVLSVGGEEIGLT